MKLKDFIDSGFLNRLDKIKGSAVGIYIDPSSREVTADSSAESERQAVEKLTGKKIWVVVKGTSACRDYIRSLLDAKSPEIKQIGGGYYEIAFEDFSLYNRPLSLGWSEILMDAREVILPLKKAVEYASPRGYVFSIMERRLDRKYYFMPYLKYPKAVLPFINWLVKKKKITLPKGKLVLWNKTQKIEETRDKPGFYDLSEWCLEIQEFGVGVPMTNIKTKEQIDDLNSYLKNTVKPTLEKSKADKTNCSWVRYRSALTCPDHIDITTLDITQDMVDEYINEANSTTYKVLR